jgi:hypothetical protein
MTYGSSIHPFLDWLNQKLDWSNQRPECTIAPPVKMAMRLSPFSRSHPPFSAPQLHFLTHFYTLQET